MIYTAYDYLAKYSDTLSEIINMAEIDGYTFDYIEKVLVKSCMIKELEQSNITLIAFSSSMKLYRGLFPNSKASTYDIKLFSSHYWIGESYINLFLKYKVNFQTLFLYLPIEKMHRLYVAYHEMDITHLFQYFEELRKTNTFTMLLKDREMSLKTLSIKTGISLPTLKALKEGKRDFKNLNSGYLEKIAHYLGCEMQTLLGNITLEIKDPVYCNV